MNFSNWIKNTGRTQNQIAGELGVSRPFITQILGGHKKPSWKIAQRIRKISGGEVTAEDLMDEFSPGE